MNVIVPYDDDSLILRMYTLCANVYEEFIEVSNRINLYLLTGMHSTLTGPIHMADEEGSIRAGGQLIIKVFTTPFIILPYSSWNPTGHLGLQKCSILRRHCDSDPEEYGKTIVNCYYRMIIILYICDMPMQIPSSGASIECFSSRNDARRSTGDISFLAFF